MNVTDSAHNSIINSMVVTEIIDDPRHHLTDRNRQKITTSTTSKAPSPIMLLQQNVTSPVRAHKKASLDSFLSRQQKQRTKKQNHHFVASSSSPTTTIDKRQVGAGKEQQQDDHDDATERTATETDFNDGSLHGSSWHSLRSTSSSWHSPQRTPKSKAKANKAKLPLRAAPHYHPRSEDDDAAVSFADLQYHRLLGEGFFGRVWLVSQPKQEQDSTSTDNDDTNTNKQQHYYALKKLSKYHLLCEDQVENTVREKQLLRQLHHPNIIRLWASHQDGAYLYLLLDYCPGGDLFALLHNHDSNNHTLMTEPRARFYATCLADALWYLHCRTRTVYRDLKPENVVIDRCGYPVLVDFGYARQLEQDEKAFTLCGTPRYVAPEMIAGAGHGFAVDYWALGVIVYEMLSRDHPFEFWDGMDDFSLYNSIAEADYLPLDDGETNASKDARDFVDQLLVKDPARRLGNDERDDHNGVLQHPWLRQQDVPALRRHLVPAPWVPPAQQQQQHDDDNESTTASGPVNDDGDDHHGGLIAEGDTKLTQREQQKFADF